MDEKELLRIMELCFNPVSYARLQGEDSYKVHHREYAQMLEILKGCKVPVRETEEEK